MKLSYEIEIEPDEIEALIKIVKNVVKEFLGISSENKPVSSYSYEGIPRSPSQEE